MVVSDREDELILQFACRWIPYGGPDPADMFVEFGMTPTQFWRRVAAAISDPALMELVPAQRAHLEQFMNAPRGTRAEMFIAAAGKPRSAGRRSPTVR